MHMSRALAAVLTTAALTAPTAATAQPEAPIPPPTQAAHTSHIRQDLRSPDARDAAKGRYLGYVRSHGAKIYVQPSELAPASEQAAASSGSTHGAKVYVQPSELAPTGEQAAASSGSTQTQPATSAPAVDAGDGNNGIDWATIALGMACSILAFTGITALNNRRNRRQRAIGATH